jgi:hypothetical protein
MKRIIIVAFLVMFILASCSFGVSSPTNTNAVPEEKKIKVIKEIEGKQKEYEFGDYKEDESSSIGVQ